MELNHNNTPIKSPSSPMIWPPTKVLAKHRSARMLKSKDFPISIQDIRQSFPEFLQKYFIIPRIQEPKVPLQ